MSDSSGNSITLKNPMLLQPGKWKKVGSMQRWLNFTNSQDSTEDASAVQEVDANSCQLAKRHQEGERPQWLAAILVAMICLVIGYVHGGSAFALSHFNSLPDDNTAFKGNVSLVGTIIYSDVVLKPSPLQGLTESQANWIGSLVAVGGMLGSLTAAAMTDILGHKALLIIMMASILASRAVLFDNNTLGYVYVSRLLAGYSMGIASLEVPMYTEEIAEVHRRGALLMTAAWLLPLGLELALVTGYWLPFQNLFSMGLPCIAVLCITGLLYLAPDSPLFLVRRGLWRSARKALRYLRGPRANVEQLIADLEERIVSARPPVRTRIAMLLMLFRQLSGTHAFALYAVDRFSSAEFATSGQIRAIIFGFLQIVSTLLSSLFVDTIGRRPLLIVSAVGMSIPNFCLAYYFKIVINSQDECHLWWMPEVATFVFIIMYNLGFGPVPWVMTSELIPTTNNRWDIGIVGLVNWGGMFFIWQIFNYVCDVKKQAFAFMFFSVSCMTASAFVFLFVPETMGRTVEEIQDILHCDQGRKGNGNVRNAL